MPHKSPSGGLVDKSLFEYGTATKVDIEGEDSDAAGGEGASSSISNSNLFAAASVLTRPEEDACILPLASTM
jgi:hypothetical protein